VLISLFTSALVAVRSIAMSVSACLSVCPLAYLTSSAVAEMGDRLATIGMGRRWAGAAVGSWVPI